MTDANRSPEPTSNGSSSEPEIVKVFEPLDEGRFTEQDYLTGQREMAYEEDVLRELGIEKDEDEEANND